MLSILRGPGMFTFWRQAGKFTLSRLATGASVPLLGGASLGQLICKELWLPPSSTTFGTSAPKHEEEKLFRENLNFFPLLAAHVRHVKMIFTLRSREPWVLFTGTLKTRCSLQSHLNENMGVTFFWALHSNGWARLLSGGQKWEQDGVDFFSSRVYCLYCLPHTLACVCTHTQLGFFPSLSGFSSTWFFITKISMFGMEGDSLG